MKFENGDSSGLVGFDRVLTDEDLIYVKEHVKTVSGVEVTWSFSQGEFKVRILGI